MSVVVVKGVLRETLAAADAPLEVCDSSGRVLGYYSPAKADPWPQVELDIAPEELARRVSAGGGRPLADILRDLGT